jgi:hypothetical protein
MTTLADLVSQYEADNRRRLDSFFAKLAAKKHGE